MKRRISLLLAVLILMSIACESMETLVMTSVTPPAVTSTTLPVTSTPELISTEQLTLQPTHIAIYEAQVTVDHLRLRNGDGSETGTQLNIGDYVTVVTTSEFLGTLAVPDPPGGQWCLIEPREFDEWLACNYLKCSRHCTEFTD